jgi:hypothetical protein
MKNLYFTIVLLLLITGTAIAQTVFVGVGIGINPWAINKAYMAKKPWVYNVDYLSNPSYIFKVMMKDSSVLEIDSKIHVDTIKRMSYLVYKNKTLKRSDTNRVKKIYANQTLKISRPNDMDYRMKTIEGFATDSCWLFKVIIGKINVYSHLSETINLDNNYIMAIQAGNGLVQKRDSATLATFIQGNVKAMKALKKKDYYIAIYRFNNDDK